MDIVYMSRLVMMREALDFPFPVTSGFRCRDYNDALYVKYGAEPGTHLDGPHTTGHATDINLVGERLAKFLRMGLQHGLTGIGLKQHGPMGKRFVHSDDLTRAPGRPRPHLWTYD